MPQKRDAETILRKAAGLAESITAKNWREKKTVLLALLSSVVKDGQTALVSELSMSILPWPDQPGEPCRAGAFTGPGGQAVKELMSVEETAAVNLDGRDFEIH